MGGLIGNPKTRHVRLETFVFGRNQKLAVGQFKYPPKKPTFFLGEAVTQYLTESGVRSTFDFLANTAQGSRLVFTYVHKDFIEGKALYRWESGYARFVKSRIWLFGIEPERCGAFLEEYGWRVLEDCSYDQLAGRYIAPTGRPLTATPVERIVYAVKI